VKSKRMDFCSLQGSTAPENFTGCIKKICPSHLLIIDAFDMGKEAGAAMIFGPQDAKASASFSTHRMPIEIMVNYLCKSISCCVIILGIQPGSLKFGGAVSKKVNAAAKDIVKIIRKIVE
ncbi:MAG TPA: hydrogenase maturation protease, partial [Candidatus Omnitrophota bacterium]|nr:hydrogenase maturation protease [Candidatus Omnitrophota bacterium]